MNKFAKTVTLIGICAVVGSVDSHASDPLQVPDCGIIDRIQLYSPQLEDSVDIDVWRPDDYQSDKKYAVLYMHDGQNLFDATTTWNHQSWEMDQTACALIAEDEVRPFIIVGIHSNPATRVSQLMPQQAVTEAGLDSLMSQVKLKGMPVQGDAYASFVVNTLKPLIDTTYSVNPDSGNTFVMGSSMGGLMSLYLFCMYPEVFGGAGCMSTHWYGADAAQNSFGDAMMNFVETHLPDPATHRIYFDHGTATIDQWYGPWETRALLIAQNKGYKYGQNLDSYVDYGAPHEESAWAVRTPRPLKFLLGH